MKEKTKELVNKVGTDTSGKWVYYDRIDDLVQLVVDECISACENASTKFAATTYDSDMIVTAKAMCIQAIISKFKE